MKVLHIITRMNTGGPAVFLDHLTKSMADLGTKSIIAYGYCESNETDYTDTHQLKAELIKIKSLHRSLNPFDDIKSFFQIRKIIQSQQPDIVNTHTSKAGVLGRLAAKSVNKKTPIVHTFHGHLIYGYFARYKIFLFTLIERLLSKFTNAAAAITNETRESLQKLGIGKKLKWQVIQLGIPITSSNLPNLTDNAVTELLWVGRFTDVKDPLYAVTVLKELDNLHPKRYRLTMVGGGELLDEVKKFATNLPIKFTGWLDKPFETVGYFDLLLLTSKNEGMGLVILEAANFSRATVARNVGGVAEFIQDGVNGILVDDSAEVMSKRIATLSKIEIFNLGKNAHQTLLKGFTDKVMANNYYKLYKSLI
jgi:glycosyltransferase involved in cell wall biosynthesis